MTAAESTERERVAHAAIRFFVVRRICIPSLGNESVWLLPLSRIVVQVADRDSNLLSSKDFDTTNSCVLTECAI